MTHIALDATGSSSRNIPLSTPTVGGYVTGFGGIRWSSEDFARFVNSGIIRYNQDNSTDPQIGNVFDLERGAGTFAGGVAWSHGKVRLHEMPRIYVQESNLSLLEQELAAGGIDVYEIQLANWNLTRAEAEQRLSGRIKSVQCQSPTSNPHTLVPGSHLTLQQANIDVSVCADDWFPPPRPLPTPHGVANAGVHVDLKAGDWHVTPEPGNIRLGVHGTGHWDIEPLPGEGDYWCAKVRIKRGE